MNYFVVKNEFGYFSMSRGTSNIYSSNAVSARHFWTYASAEKICEKIGGEIMVVDAVSGAVVTCPNKTKYDVVLTYSGTIHIEVEATNEDEALAMAENIASTMDDATFLTETELVRCDSYVEEIKHE